jgi:hypothetical protein
MKKKFWIIGLNKTQTKIHNGWSIFITKSGLLGADLHEAVKFQTREEARKHCHGRGVPVKIETLIIQNQTEARITLIIHKPFEGCLDFT